MKSLIGLLLCSVLVTACISNSGGSGVEAKLYRWDNRSVALASRTTIEDVLFDDLLTGDLYFGDILEELPTLDSGEDTPYLLEICENSICNYLVIFPAELELNGKGNVNGFGVVSPLSTALYYQVRELPADEVRDALDAWAPQLLNDEVDRVADGSIDYADIFALDYERFTDNVALFIDGDLPTRVATAIGSGEEIGISELLATTTGNNNALQDAWLVNTTSKRSDNIFESGSNQGVLVNVQSVAEISTGGSDYVVVSATGVPDYELTMTTDLLDWLSSRPQASSDFSSGAPTAIVDEVLSFGEDLGYDSNSDCVNTGGDGYWPPGPTCPTDQAHEVYLPVAASAAAEDCETGAGSVGYYVNGTSVFNWTDAQSYNGDGVWYTLAPVAEVYDVDICGGHAANGEYHHHFYSDCLAELVGDEGDSHSPVYGFAADGYPIYGPWENAGELARSAWRSRDYDDPDSDSGCGQAGVRNCLLVDQYDPGAGVEAASSNGPSTSDSYTSLSQNIFATTTGFFFEDWYFDSSLTQQGGVYLDQYNGHTDSQRGYHYHVTIELENDVATPAFPYSVGPRFAGELQDNASASCATGIGGGGGPPGPPSGPPPGP
jgi:hypothetical protein